MDMTEFLEWLEDIIDPHLEAEKADMWLIDEGMIRDLVEKGLFYRSTVGD